MKTENIYNKAFYKQVKNIIGTSESFIKKNRKERNLVFEKLKELTVLSEFTNTFKEVDLSFFKEEMKIFNEMYSKELKKVIKRRDSANFSNQFNIFVNLVIEYLTDNGYILYKIDSSSIIDELKSDRLFLIILNSYLSSLDYFSLSNEEHDYNLKVNQVNRLKVHYTLIKNLLTHIIYLILQKEENASFNFSVVYQKIPEIINDKNKKNEVFIKCAIQITIIFNKIFDVKSDTFTVFKDGETRSVCYLTLPEKFEEYNITPTHIPQIIEPDTNYDNMFSQINLFKKIKNGISDVKLSQKTKKALKISDKKQFRINPNCIKLFEILDETDYELIKNVDCLPFTPLTYLNFLEELIVEKEKKLPENIKEKLNNLYQKLNDDKRKENKEKKKSYKKVTDELLKTFEIEEKDYIEYKEIKKLKRELANRRRLRIVHNTVLEFAKTFNGFPIYFINSFDYRLRMYPWNFMFNRTSGIYKYLMMEPKTIVNQEGVSLMLKAYFKNEIKIDPLKNKNELLKEFKRFTLEKELKNESPIYHILLGMEIENLMSRKFQSGFLIEIDQKSSSSVLLSLMLGDRTLAEVSNLISCDEPKDANKFIMDESVKWYKNKLKDKSYEVFSKEKKLHKYLFMCYIYNQTFDGRMKRLHDYIEDDEDKKFIANTYPVFVNDVYPSLTIKREKLNDIVKFHFQKNNQGIELETLDESILTWYVYRKLKDTEKNIKMKVKNPLDNKEISFDYKFYDKKSLDLKKILGGFIPSFIHSIDGAIMRLIILEVYDSDKYIINHLHDSIQFHPNKYNLVIDSIKKIYCSEDLRNMLMSRFFNRLKTKFLKEDLSEFNDMIDDFYKLDYEEIIIIESNINIYAMFPLE